jgi:hypothetical protein
MLVACDVHQWERATIYVSPDPYFAVTDAAGSARSSVPPGHYTLEAWHETMGNKSVEVAVMADSSSEVAFDFP